MLLTKDFKISFIMILVVFDLVLCCNFSVCILAIYQWYFKGFWFEFQKYRILVQKFEFKASISKIKGFRALILFSIFLRRILSCEFQSQF